MNKAELEQRTKEFSLNLIRFLQSLPKNYLGEAMGRQLLKSGTSIGANYREANRAESKADFIHKLAIAEKEASETVYWLELMTEAGIATARMLPSFYRRPGRFWRYLQRQAELPKNAGDAESQFSIFEIRISKSKMV